MKSLYCADFLGIYLRSVFMVHNHSYHLQVLSSVSNTTFCFSIYSGGQPHFISFMLVVPFIVVILDPKICYLTCPRQSFIYQAEVIFKFQCFFQLFSSRSSCWFLMFYRCSYSSRHIAFTRLTGTQVRIDLFTGMLLILYKAVSVRGHGCGLFMIQLS